ncbi:MAG: hypothetical protein ACI9XR_002539 [Flavobacterium sp.]|jgi:hypothetical protein
MKKILILLTILNFSAFAQTINLDGANENYGKDGFYYQDTNDVLGNFVGTYVLDTGSTKFTVVLQKKMNSSFGGAFTEDILIGGYKYEINNVEKINTLSSLNINYADGTNYPINANNILTGNEMGCTDCGANEKHLYGSIYDPVSGAVDDIFIRKTMVGNQQAIKLFILHKMRLRYSNEPPIPLPAFPTSVDLILIKQP